MYCGKNKTALTSLDQIAEALIDLLRRKGFDRISVSELCRESGISRQTFYNLYQSKENVMIYVLQDKYCSIPDTEDDDPLMLICREYAQYIYDNRELLSLLTRNQIIYLLYDSICDSLNSCCSFTGACSARGLPLFSTGFFAGAITGFVIAYCNQQDPMSCSELQDSLYQLFSMKKG